MDEKPPFDVQEIADEALTKARCDRGHRIADIGHGQKKQRRLERDTAGDHGKQHADARLQADRGQGIGDGEG